MTSWRLLLALQYTVCFTELDQGSKMIIFESILSTFIAMVLFSSKNWLKLKIKLPLVNLACLNRWNTLYTHVDLYRLDNIIYLDRSVFCHRRNLVQTMYLLIECFPWPSEDTFCPSKVSCSRFIFCQFRFVIDVRVDSYEVDNFKVDNFKVNNFLRSTFLWSTS